MTAGMLSCPVEEQYRPPTGFFDFPYIYVSDYTAIVAAGADPRTGLDIRQALDLDANSSFILRRATKFAIDSLDNFQLYDRSERFCFSTPVRGDSQSVYPLVPELVYTPGAALRYDVLGWASSTTLTFGVGGPFAYVAQILFQGVKRFKGGEPNPVRSGYRYQEVPFSYTQRLNLNWTFLDLPYIGLIRSAPRRFTINNISEGDFELQRISVVQTGGAVVNNVNSPSFRMLLLDSTRRRMMSEHVYAAGINQSMTGNTRLLPAFPVPSIVYPMGSSIEYEIVSHLDDPAGGGAPAAQSFDIVFSGVRRRPA